MDGVKWVVDPNEVGELPQPQEVSRAMLAVPDFDVEKFLLSISDFRTLRDVKEVVSQWETRLHADLRKTVNDNFDDFVKSATSINNGIAPLESVYNDTVRYASDAAAQNKSLEDASRALEKELNVHKALCKEESNALRVLHMLDLQQELEGAIVEAEPKDVDTVISLARSFVSMAVIAEDMKYVKVVQVRTVSMAAIGSEIVGFLESASSTSTNSDDKFALLEALYFVKEELQKLR